MKTNVYIDGFNFYYGLLKNSEHKWLDLVKLFDDFLCPDDEIVKVKLYTAPVLAKFATNGQKAQNSQERYWNALLKLYPEQFEVIKGFYSHGKQNAMRHISPPNKGERVDIWKLEEKLTDVQMSLGIYRDAIRNECEQVILVSNDSDIEPSAQLVKQDTDVSVGVVLPRTEGGKRTTSGKLCSIADWHLGSINEETLKASQLPRSIPTRKKPIIKPDYW
jgi:uncharacterized LabA/DUF88 family protein